VHTWGGRSYHNQITLNRLSNRESLLMVTHLLGEDTVEPQLEKHILGKTEGVPFFIEEFVKYLQGLDILKTENGTIRFKGDPQATSIPSTVQDMIMARVDRLSDDTKTVLQVGSVIEREFSHDMIRAITTLPEPELLTHLSALKDAELLYERGIYPQIAYIFRHALTREVVYASILADRRRTLHHKIGTAIEEIHKENLDENYEILTEHFYQSQDYSKTAIYAKQAAKKAMKSSSLLDAIIHARKRVHCLEKLPDSEEGIKERIDARTVLGLYLGQLNNWVEARDTVAPVAQLARDKDYLKGLGRIQALLGACYSFIDENFAKGLDAIQEALSIAEKEKNLITMLLASYWLGIMQSFDCDFENAENSFQRAIDISIAGGTKWGPPIYKSMLSYQCYFFEGKIGQLKQLTSEALKTAEESVDLMSRSTSHISSGFARLATGHLEEAISHALEGKNLLEYLGVFDLKAAAFQCLALSYLEMKSYDKSRDFFAQASQTHKKNNTISSVVGHYHLGMTLCEVMLGKRDINLRSLRDIQERNRIKMVEGWNCQFLGAIFLNLGGSYVNEAERWIRQAIAADGKNGMKLALGLDHALYGKFFKRQGDQAKAQEELGKATEIMRECGADGWVVKYEKELAELQ
jgi:tetratricopeptide (TPR) repeat protein